MSKLILVKFHYIRNVMCVVCCLELKTSSFAVMWGGRSIMFSLSGLFFTEKGRFVTHSLCNGPIEFNLRLDHGLYRDVRDWLT